MPVIPVSLQPPGAAVGPQANPNAFGAGGAALQQFGAIAQDEIDRRIAQNQASQLASLRATAQNRIAAFTQEIERDPDYATYPMRWEQQQQALSQELSGSVEPVVWDAFQPEWMALTGNGTRTVRDLAYAREDDHNITLLTGSNRALLDQAGLPGVDHALNMEMIQRNYVEAYRSGLISESDAADFARRDMQDYRFNQEYAAIGRDPVGYYLSHTTGTPTAPDAPVNPDFAPEVTGNGQLQGVSPAVVDAVTRVGETLGQPLTIISGYRSQEHQDELRERDIAEHGGQPSGQVAEHSRHTDGLALDISTAGMSEERKAEMVSALLDAGFTGIGEYSGHIHADFRSTVARWTSFSPEVQAVLDARGATPGAASSDIARPTVGSIPPAGITDPRQQEQLLNHAERLADRALQAARIDIAARVEDEATALSLGLSVDNPLSDGEIMSAFVTDPGRGADIAIGLHRARELSGTIDDMNGMSNAEVRAFIDAERQAMEEGGTAGLADRSERFAALQTASQDILTAREDPAAYVIQRDPDLAEAFRSADTPEAMADAIRNSLAQQTFVDRPDDRRPLPNSIIASVMEQYNGTEDPHQRLAYLSGVTSALRDDAAATLVLDQLEEGGLDPGARVILDSDMTEPQAADMLAMLEGYAEIEQRFEERVPVAADRTDAQLEIQETYDDDRGTVWDTRNGLLGIDQQTLALAENERETVRRLSIAFALQGDATDFSGAASQVMDALFGHQEAIGAAIITVPATTEDRSGYIDNVSNGMDNVLDALPQLVPLDDLLTYTGLPVDSVTREAAESAYEDMRDDAEWVNVGDGFGIVMPARGFGGRLLSDASGEPMTWTADELARAGDTEALAAALAPDMRRSIPPRVVPAGIPEDTVPSAPEDDLPRLGGTMEPARQPANTGQQLTPEIYASDRGAGQAFIDTISGPESRRTGRALQLLWDQRWTDEEKQIYRELAEQYGFPMP